MLVAVGGVAVLPCYTVRCRYPVSVAVRSGRDRAPGGGEQVEERADPVSVLGGVPEQAVPVHGVHDAPSVRDSQVTSAATCALASGNDAPTKTIPCISRTFLLGATSRDRPSGLATP